MPETRGQALEAIGESFVNHRSNVGSWAHVRVLRKLVSRVGRRGGVSSSGSSSAGSAAERSVERLDKMEITVEHSMAGGLGEEVEVIEEALLPVNLESPTSAMNSSEEEIELGILAVPAPVRESKGYD
jgi:hypothetical protein